MTAQYRAKVISIEHPGGLMMAQVKVMGLWDGIPNDDCPWAEYLLPVGGSFVPCSPGDLVWVDFPYGGDSRLPRIVGAAQDAPGGKPNVPPESWNGPGAYKPERKDGQPPAPPITPTKDFVFKRNGLLERRTAGGGWSITHTLSGTELGINDSGQVTILSAKNVYVEGTEDITVKTAKSINLNALLDIVMKAGGKVSIEADGKVSILCAGLDVDWK